MHYFTVLTMLATMLPAALVQAICLNQIQQGDQCARGVVGCGFGANSANAVSLRRTQPVMGVSLMSSQYFCNSGTFDRLYTCQNGESCYCSDGRTACASAL